MGFTAYFDASGTEKDNVLTMAGFISRPERWARLEEEWKSLLPPTVTMFHMTDFASSRNGWEAWKGDGRRRAIFFESLISCIKKHTIQGFSESLEMNDFREVDAAYQVREGVGGPYAFLALACLGGLKEWARKKPASWRKILCILEDGDEGQGDAIRRLRAEGYHVIPQSKAEIRAFDTCDLAAWKARRIIDDAWHQGRMGDAAGADRIVASLDQLEKIVVTKKMRMFTTRSLTSVCEALGIPKRQRTPGRVDMESW